MAFVKLDRPAGDVRSDELIHGLLHGSVYFDSDDKGFETYRTKRVGSSAARSTRAPDRSSR